MKNKLFSLVTIIALLLTCLTPVFGAGGSKQPQKMFYLEFFQDTSDFGKLNRLDLSNIKVDVYSSTLTAYDNNSDISEFTHTFAFSAYTDANGSVKFMKPSNEFLLLVDVSSLPSNMGVEIQTVFYHSDALSDRIGVSKVEQVQIEYDDSANHRIVVNAFNYKGNRVNIDYSVSENNTAQSEKMLITENTGEISGIVIIGDIIETYKYTIQYTPEQRMEYVKEALENGDVSKAEALNFYFDVYAKSGRCPELYEQISIICEDTAFYEGLTKEEQEIISRILSPPSYNRTHSVGYFNIYYTYPTPTPVPAFITSLMTALETADTSLAGGLTLTKPKSTAIGTAKYHVYVTSDYSDSVAYCQPETTLGVRTSYIVYPNITNAMLGKNITDYNKGDAAHEYMHAIIHTYRNSPDLPKWFKEAWCEWALVRVTDIDHTPVSFVNNFLNNSFKTLTDDADAYGKLLFPLYIKQNHSGDTTVANAVKNLGVSTNTVITAISNALPGSNTFASILPGFSRFNYSPKTLYSIKSKNWRDKPFLSAQYTLNNYPNNANGGNINPYASHYREFDVPMGVSYKLDITVNLTNNSTTFTGKLIMTGSSGSITDWNFNVSGSLVTYSTTMGASTYVKGGVVFTSAHPTSQTGYYITIKRS